MMKQKFSGESGKWSGDNREIFPQGLNNARSLRKKERDTVL